MHQLLLIIVDHVKLAADERARRSFLKEQRLLQPLRFQAADKGGVVNDHEQCVQFAHAAETSIACSSRSVFTLASGTESVAYSCA